MSVNSKNNFVTLKLKLECKICISCSLSFLDINQMSTFVKNLLSHNKSRVNECTIKEIFLNLSKNKIVIANFFSLLPIFYF